MADEQKVSPQLQQFLMQVTVLHRNMQHAKCAPKAISDCYMPVRTRRLLTGTSACTAAADCCKAYRGGPRDRILASCRMHKKPPCPHRMLKFIRTDRYVLRGTDMLGQMHGQSRQLPQLTGDSML
jgi:hypothetical protein